ncbi:MAG TPA: hypothetical protein ENG43_00550, partial [Candidatus Bathyarchaeota archaeon]|nr:hypothetical protein [Candidatus Bathyarchaeota archaeon]HEW89816.1 hypothetical protein [Candidatus Bathyarchaeota archaeon]
MGAKRIYEIEPKAPYSLKLTFTGTEPAFPSVFDGGRLWRVVRTSSGALVPLGVEQKGPVDEPLLKIEVLLGSVEEEGAE